MDFSPQRYEKSQAELKRLADKTLDFILTELPDGARTVALVQALLVEIQDAVYHRRLELS